MTNDMFADNIREGSIDAVQFRRLMESTRENWQGWKERLERNGPTDLDAQKMMLQIASSLAHMGTMYGVYFHYPPTVEEK